MNQKKEIEERITRYLEMVAANIAGVPADEKEEILRNVESHIYEALSERAGENPTIADVEAVLAEMDPPDSYAGTDKNAGESATNVPVSDAKICKTALLGTLWIPFGFLVVFVFMGVAVGNPLQESALFIIWKHIKLTVILPFALSSPFGSTTLGWIAVSKIRSAHGRLIGMPLAVGVGLFYPLCALDGVLAYCAALLCQGSWRNHWQWVAVISAIIILALDFYIIRVVWKWACRNGCPSKAPEDPGTIANQGKDNGS